MAVQGLMISLSFRGAILLTRTSSAEEVVLGVLTAKRRVSRCEETSPTTQALQTMTYSKPAPALVSFVSIRNLQS